MYVVFCKERLARGAAEPVYSFKDLHGVYSQGYLTGKHR